MPNKAIYRVEKKTMFYTLNFINRNPNGLKI